MTDIKITLTGLTAIAHSVGVTDAQARALMEYAGVKVQPEKPALPTDPESIITATEVRGVTGKWRMMLDLDGEWFSPEEICGNLHHQPDHITVWTETRVLPATSTPVTLTDDQMGVLWDAVTASDPGASPWVGYLSPHRARFKAVVNAALAKHATPAEGEADRPH